MDIESSFADAHLDGPVELKVYREYGKVRVELLARDEGSRIDMGVGLTSEQAHDLALDLLNIEKELAQIDQHKQIAEDAMDVFHDPDAPDYSDIRQMVDDGEEDRATRYVMRYRIARIIRDIEDSPDVFEYLRDFSDEPPLPRE